MTLRKEGKKSLRKCHLRWLSCVVTTSDAKQYCNISFSCLFAYPIPSFFMFQGLSQVHGCVVCDYAHFPIFFLERKVRVLCKVILVYCVVILHNAYKQMWEKQNKRTLARCPSLQQKTTKPQWRNTFCFWAKKSCLFFPMKAFGRV